MAPQPQPALHLDSKAIRTYSQRTAAAAPDTLVAEETVQQPSVEFLGVLKDMQTVKGVIHTAAAPDLVFDILTDYDSCSRVFRNISGSQTLFTDAGDKQVIQVCRSCWPARLDGGRLSSGSAVVCYLKSVYSSHILQQGDVVSCFRLAGAAAVMPTCWLAMQLLSDTPEESCSAPLALFAVLFALCHACAVLCVSCMPASGTGTFLGSRPLCH